MYPRACLLSKAGMPLQHSSHWWLNNWIVLLHVAHHPACERVQTDSIEALHLLPYNTAAASHKQCMQLMPYDCIWHWSCADMWHPTMYNAVRICDVPLNAT